MEKQEVFSVNDQPRYNFKSYPYISLLDDPLGTFSQVLKNVLHIEDIRGYINYKIESIGDSNIHRDLENICKNDLSLKPKFANLERLNLVEHMFYMDFDNQD